MEPIQKPKKTAKPKKIVAALLVKYNTLKTKKVAKTLTTKAYAEVLVEVCLECLQSLKTECSRVPCVSLIQGKTYHVYRRTTTFENRQTTRTTRPINSTLFIDDEHMLASSPAGELQECGLRTAIRGNDNLADLHHCHVILRCE